MIRIPLTGLIIAVFAASLAFGSAFSNTGNSPEEPIIFGWKLFFHNEDFETYNFCVGILVNPRTFVTDSWCVQEYLSTDTNQRLFISKMYNHGFLKMYHINKTNIYFNKDLYSHYDASKRNVAVLITNEPINPFKDVHHQAEFVQLVEDPEDVDYSTCYVLLYNDIKVKSIPCDAAYNNMVESADDFFLCQFIPGIELGSPVVCDSELEPNSTILVGISSGNSWFENDDVMTAVVMFDRVLDLGVAIKKILQEIV